MSRIAPLIAALALASVLAVVVTACGGGDPEAEATWETHTTDPDESAGGEDVEE